MWGIANSTVAFFLSSFSFFSQSPEPSIIAQTQYGAVEGLVSQTRGGRTIFEFTLPYAFPPVGSSLRFKPPIPWNKSWEGVREAKEVPRCVQYHLIARQYSGDEDCLYIFVYTHKFKRVGEGDLLKSELKPVIFYVHGGIFMQGTGSFYKPKYLLENEDCVFVSLQYRVGALGFLNLENDDIQGNMGLKDQVEALNWIRQNIDVFCGDKERVVIMGESAGSVSAHLHMLSPMSKGLFHRVICQSGSGLMSWAIQEEPLEQAKFFAASLGCPTNSTEEISACLKQLDAKQLGRAHKEAATMLHNRFSLFGPTIEFGTGNSEKFLSERPERIIKSGNFNKVPLLIGVNSEEGLLYAAPMVRNQTARIEINQRWNYWIPIVFRFAHERNSSEIADKIREYYFGNVSAKIGDEELPILIKLVTDRLFMEGFHHTLRLHRGLHPIYPYVYSYKGQFSFGNVVMLLSYDLPIVMDFLLSQSKRWVKTKLLRRKEKSYGTAHGDELPLLFNLPFQDLNNEKHPDYKMSKALVQGWTTFARDGVPPQMQNEIWKDLSESNDDELKKPIQLLRIDSKMEVMDDPFEARAGFWKSLNMNAERD